MTVLTELCKRTSILPQTSSKVMSIKILICIFLAPLSLFNKEFGFVIKISSMYENFSSQLFLTKIAVVEFQFNIFAATVEYLFVRQHIEVIKVSIDGFEDTSRQVIVQSTQGFSTLTAIKQATDQLMNSNFSVKCVGIPIPVRRGYSAAAIASWHPRVC